MSRCWLTNTLDPKRPKASTRWQKLRTGETIGRPKATEHHTVEELEAMRIVGVYVEEQEVKAK